MPTASRGSAEGIGAAVAGRSSSVADIADPTVVVRKLRRLHRGPSCVPKSDDMGNSRLCLVYERLSRRSERNAEVPVPNYLHLRLEAGAPASPNLPAALVLNRPIFFQKEKVFAHLTM